MSHLNFGILGTADVVKRYTADAIRRSQHTQLAGIASRELSRAQVFAEKFDTKAFGSYEALLADPTINAVYIPLPIGLHEEWTLKALKAGKHVLCEKSLSGRYQQSKRMIEAAKENGLVLAENFMCEHHTQNIFVQNLLNKNEIGKIRSSSLSFGFPPKDPSNIRYKKSLDCGALNDTGAYCVNMAIYYLNRYPVSLWATLSNEDKQVDIAGSITLHFDDGSTANLNFGFDHDYRNEARFWGSAGSLAIDRCFSIPPDRKPNVKLIRNNEVKEFDLLPCNHFIAQLDRLAELVKSRETINLKKLTRQALLLEAVRISSAEQRIVKMDEFADWLL